MKPNDKVLGLCVGVVVGMIGLSYASVPLYRIFCQVTGFAGTPRIAVAASDTVSAETMEVRFDANVGQGLPWEFGPERVSMKVRLGENTVAHYRAHNTSSVPVVGTATFNVTPDQIGSFFNKIACFCFTEQRLEPGESVEMPVSFFIDPAIVNDLDGAKVRNITLSYTFYPVDKPKSPKSAERPQDVKPPG